uniref:Uncharacterized protein n=1 Tax=Utricularia reniformis TaxID=192314 RepID=A0A1Y0AZM0_9LAMI|nr:hypothetical protein AEK19_MT0304 [Utricularia reniformis]ART30579.1 hypothetical protein AEK19_MT0304 [Utricularia reniformis]
MLSIFFYSGRAHSNKGDLLLLYLCYCMGRGACQVWGYTKNKALG